MQETYRPRRDLKARLLAGAIWALIAAGAGAARAQAPAPVDIPAGTLDAALALLAGQTQQQVLYKAELVANRRAPAVKGMLTSEEALGRLLEGTGIAVKRTGPNVLVLQDQAPEGRRTAGDVGRRPFDARGPEPDAPAAAVIATGPGPAAPVRTAPPTLLDELTVVGSLIRGVADGPSPVLVLDRDQLDRSGHATVAAALAALPQNFSGSANEALNNTGGERQGTNSHFGAGLNLRGLGSDATLVLVNGRRMAGAGSNAEFADISTIPTAAVERVELLLDGASALYGSDAVGGVVNIVLRRRFEGAETRLMSGVATSGEPFEAQVGQTLGGGWRGGSGLLAYEYHQRNVLHGDDREVARNADLRGLGGTDHRTTFSFPGNILRVDPATGTNSPYWAVPAGQPGVGLGPADFRADTVNLRNQREGVDILPRQTRHSVYASVRQGLTDRVELSADARYGHRKYGLQSGLNTGLLTITRANPFFVSPNGSSSTSVQYAFAELPSARAAGTSESLGLSLGAEARLWAGWRAEAYGTYARETGRSTNTGLLNAVIVGEAIGATPDRPETAYDPRVDGYFNPFAGQAANSAAVLAALGSGYSRIQNRGVSKSLNAKADGSLLRLPGGEVKLAVGAQHRVERFTRSGVNFTSSATPLPVTSVDVERTVDAAFAELRVPIFGTGNRRPGFERLELSVAGRVERYSDFGWTQNPKLGVLWAPRDGLLVRASYGRSFRAPALRELQDPQVYNSSLLASKAGRVGALIQTGGNPDLDPETARSFTAGLDWRVEAVPGLRLGLSWFDVNFKDRIDRPVQANIATALDDPNVAPFVRRITPATNADDRALIAALLADPATRTVLGPPEAYGAILDSRYVNTAALRVSGLDAMAAYERTIGADTVTVSLNATHLYRYAQRITPTAASVDLVGVATYPLDLRARAAVGWRRGPYAADLALNYASAYEDALGARIKALATFDLQLRYAPDRLPWLSGVMATLNVRNLFDAGPPFYDNTSGVAFDPSNADVVGRFVSLQLTKAW